MTRLSCAAVGVPPIDDITTDTDNPPSLQVGAFYGKAMAISDVTERLRFLNRGQGWVVRKLRQMLQRVRNDGLHADLSEMLRAHEANIILANDAVADISPGFGKAPTNPSA